VEFLEFRWMVTRRGRAGPGFWRAESYQLHSMLNQPLPERIVYYPIDHSTNTGPSRPSVQIPVKNSAAILFSDALEWPGRRRARSSSLPAENGGNMDAPEASVGNRCNLPVNVEGALLYLGDGFTRPWGTVRCPVVRSRCRCERRLRVTLIKAEKLAGHVSKTATQ